MAASDCTEVLFCVTLLALVVGKTVVILVEDGGRLVNIGRDVDGQDVVLIVRKGRLVEVLDIDVELEEGFGVVFVDGVFLVDVVVEAAVGRGEVYSLRVVVVVLVVGRVVVVVVVLVVVVDGVRISFSVRGWSEVRLSVVLVYLSVMPLPVKNMTSF